MTTARRDYGFLLVAGAAAVWGTDALFRRGLALGVPASAVVFVEHAILVVLTLPLLRRSIPRLKHLKSPDWVAVIIVGAGASATATVLFTQALSYGGDPTTPLLLQKLQPLIAIAGATMLLNERLLPHFALYVVAALTGAYLIAFPDPDAVSLSLALPALFALGAAFLWAMGTVLGRYLAGKLPFTELTAIRFAVGLPASGLVLLLQGRVDALTALGWSDLGALLLLALVPGLISLLLYYRGLRATPAAAATLAELTFPLTAILVGYIAFNAVLSGTQWLGVALVSATITMMGLAGSRQSTRGLGIDLPPGSAPVFESR